MADVKQSIQLLFDRPTEPLFMPKGDNGAVFEVSQEFLVCFKIIFLITLLNITN